MKQVWICLALYGASFTESLADYVPGSDDTLIIELSAHAKNTIQGDLRIIVDKPAKTCEGGYYVRKDNPAKADILNIALSAFHADQKVRINSYNSPRWLGSSANYCEVESITLTKGR